MRLRGSRVFDKWGIGQRISLHPWIFPVHERLREVSYPKRFPPPPGHPNQCQGIVVRTLTQCDRWAKRGSLYCAICGSDRSVSKIYEKRAGPTLKGLLEEAQEGAPEDRLSVIAEIDMARAAAAEAVRLFSVVLEDPSGKASVESRAQTVALLHQALREVANLVKTQSSILSNLDGIMTTEQFLWVVETMKKVVFEALPEDPRAEQICDRFDLIQPPSKGVAEKAVRVSFT